MALSKIDTAAIAADAIEASQLKSDAIALGDLPTGTVLQVVQYRSGTQSSVSNSGGGWKNTIYNFNITPKASGSKILVNVAFTFDVHSPTSSSFRIVRDGTAIENSADTGGQMTAGTNNGSTSWMQTMSWSVLDTGISTTAGTAVNYKLQLKAYDTNRTVHLNHSQTGSNLDDDGALYMQAIEIAG